MKNNLPERPAGRIPDRMMPSFPSPAFFLFILFICCQPLLSVSPQEGETVPFAFRKQQTGYYGPGAGDPEPVGIEEVLLAYFGPGDGDHPEHGGIWTALQIAERDVNASGGVRGKPLKILPIWTEDPWKGGISDMVRTVYEQDIWALIGSVDSASTHLLEQIAAKIRIPVISPVSTDKSANLANVPWLFSMLPGDHILAESMIARIRSLLGEEEDSFVLISGTDHDSRLFSRELQSLLSDEKLVPSYILEYIPGLPFPWHRISADTGLFIISAPPEESADLVTGIRQKSRNAKIVGGPFFGRNRFRELCGDQCAGVIHVSPGSCSPDSEFSREFRRRTGDNPDYAAGSAYDSLLIIAAALEKSGLNRTRLQEEIRGLSPWTGTTGIIAWDPLGQNTRAGSMETVSGTCATARGKD